MGQPKPAYPVVSLLEATAERIRDAIADGCTVQEAVERVDLDVRIVIGEILGVSDGSDPALVSIANSMIEITCLLLKMQEDVDSLKNADLPS
jgi:hypothetical protein